MTQPLIPEGEKTVDTAPNFRVTAPRPEEPREIKDWDAFQQRMREMTRPEDRGLLEFIPCVTPRGSTFVARIYKPKRRDYETEEQFQRRPGRVQTLDLYRFPGDGMGTHFVDGVPEVTDECDDLGQRVDPRNGRKGPGKKNGEFTWPEDIQDQTQRKVEIVKAWWHRDIAEYCGKPLPEIVRKDRVDELEELRKFKADTEAKAKKPGR